MLGEEGRGVEERGRGSGEKVRENVGGQRMERRGKRGRGEVGKRKKGEMRREKEKEVRETRGSEKPTRRMPFRCTSYPKYTLRAVASGNVTFSTKERQPAKQ